jgi:DNA-binding transcriptional LysR family regulator
MLDKLEAMAIFARVVEEESFSGAARKLGLSKSAVSKQITRLEDRLGARLLNRTTRRLSLTDAGSAFYRHCARIVEEGEAAEEAVTLLQEAPRGTLRIAAPMSFGHKHLGRAIGEFGDRYPDLRIDMDLSDQFVDLVADGYDVGIRITAMRDSSLIARKVATSRILVVASPAYLEAHGEPKTPEDLTAHKCLIYSNSTTPGVWNLTGPEGQTQIKVEPALIANNGDFLTAAAVEGRGIAMQPSFICGDDVNKGKLVPIMRDYSLTELNVYAVYPAREHLPAKVRLLIDHLVETFGGGDRPYWEPEI